VSPLDEYGALIYAGRWGIHGISLPGRVTFAPGNVGFSTFGAPRPTQVFFYQNLVSSICLAIDLYSFFFFNFFSLQAQIVNDETWKLVDDVWDKKVQDIRDEALREIEEEKEKPQLLMASHFL